MKKCLFLKLTLYFFFFVSSDVYAEVILPYSDIVQNNSNLAEVNRYVVSAPNMEFVDECVENLVLHVPTGELYDSSQELGIREGPSYPIYGTGFRFQETYTTPKCGLKREKVIKIPVLLVDWEDYNPATDLSNPNSPNSTFPNYQKKSPTEFANWLNGPSGPAQYFKDVSGNFVKLEFDVIGWLGSATVGSYLQDRASYMSFNNETQRWSCDKNAIVKDAMRDAVTFLDIDFGQYDVDSTIDSILPGVIDGLAFVFEGGAGLCSGNYMSSLSGIGWEEGNPQIEINDEQISGLVETDDVNFSKFKDQSNLYNYYVSLSEYTFRNINIEPWYVGVWNHELGHLLLGYADYYKVHNEMGEWGLSAQGEDMHPSAWEKALFGKWFEFNNIDASGGYTLITSDIADGALYGNDNYIYKILINNDPNHYLTIEYRWLERDGNTLSSWVSSDLRQSGLQIIEFNWYSDLLSTETPQVLRYSPPRDDVWLERESSFNASDIFNKCFTADFCLTIDNINLNDESATFNLNFYLESDVDGDGIANIDDAYPLIPIGDLLDTDSDGAPNQCDAACISLGMMADTDDDNDGVLDGDDDYPLDATRSAKLIRHDVDGDGNSDILWRSSTKGWNFLWTMNGTATKAAKPINVVQDDGWVMAGQGDYDADGKSDILWRNTITGLNFMYLMDGLNIKTRRVLNYVDAPQWELAGSGDFNGDSKGDVLWHDVERGRTQLYLMDGLTINTNRALEVVTDLNEKIVAVGDVNGDGTDDVIWRNQASGNNSIWLIENGLVVDMYVLNRVNVDWTIAGAGDLDGDGTDDIILRNQSDGRNWAFMMENGQIRTSQLINTVGSLDWQIANMGDYDGDGKTDFLWRNAAEGRNIVHLMDGTSIKGRGVLRPTDNTWQLAR